MKIRKISLIKTAAISFLLTIFWSASAFAQPQITGFLGTPIHKGTLTINGSGFGTKATPAPLKWDDFESGTLGANLGNGWWSTAVDGGGPLPKYDNTVLRTGSTKSVLQDYTYPGVGSTGGGRQYGNAFGLVNQSLTKVYISLYMYMTTTGASNRNYKIISLRGGLPGQWKGPGFHQGVFPIYSSGWMGPYWNCDNTGLESGSGGAIEYTYTTEGSYSPTNSWKRFEYYITHSDPPGVSNGNAYMWVDGVLKIANQTRMTRSSDCAWSNLYINGYFARELSDNDSAGYIWNDDVYIDTTQARVEISDSPTWNTAIASHREIQIPSAWSDTSITITLNQGSFANFNNVYLYVIDENGNVNTNGYLLSDGGGGNTPPPSSSSGGDASASGGSGCGFVKDVNGKGQKAKGEGVSMMILLFQLLILLRLRRHYKYFVQLD